MKIALCCIAKMENEYIREYVEYYKNLGIDKVFIYDNNDIDGEKFEGVINDYINTEFVEIINYRGKKVCQLEAYNDCYSKYNKDFDWLCFFDCDEFLTLVKHKDIKEYLSDKMFDKYDMIHINWMCYGDNNLIGNENNYERSVLKRFTTPLPYDFIGFSWCYHNCENNHIKSIIRGNININWSESWNPHTPIDDIKCCNNKAEKVNSSSPWVTFNYEYAYLKHFITKTIIEWSNKMKRGYCDQTDKQSKEHLHFDRFFKINYVTLNKLLTIK